MTSMTQPNDDPLWPASPLHRVASDAPGLTRKRAGRGFTYFDAQGRRVADGPTIQRIKDLAIPPAWSDVWICTDGSGHLQAAGTDDAGRRQSIYHPRWRERRDRQKFERVLRFAERLPTVRRRVSRDLTLPGLPEARVLACSIRLLDQAFFRIGSEAYTERNGSFGLATLRKSHVTLGRGRVAFDYTAKSGRKRHQEIRDPEVAAIVKMLVHRRGGGRELLAFDEDGRWHDVRSADINRYLKELAGDAYTAKDFRTWHATVLAAVELAVADPDGAAASKRRVIASAVRAVAGQLGNTPAVCRASYIDPRVFERYGEGISIATRLRNVDLSLDDPSLRGKVERAVLGLLRDDMAAAKAA